MAWSPIPVYFLPPLLSKRFQKHALLNSQKLTKTSWWWTEIQNRRTYCLQSLSKGWSETISFQTALLPPPTAHRLMSTCSAAAAAWDLKSFSTSLRSRPGLFSQGEWHASVKRQRKKALLCSTTCLAAPCSKINLAFKDMNAKGSLRVRMHFSFRNKITRTHWPP